MIKIDVKPYCNDCADFVPDVETFIGCCAEKGAIRQFTNHTIRCANRQKCDSLEEHIRKEMDYGKFIKENPNEI